MAARNNLNGLIRLGSYPWCLFQVQALAGDTVINVFLGKTFYCDRASFHPVKHLSILSSGEWKYTLSLHFTETEASARPMGHITHFM